VLVAQINERRVFDPQSAQRELAQGRRRAVEFSGLRGLRAFARFEFCEALVILRLKQAQLLAVFRSDSASFSR
jgi:hypothetical protein